MDNEREGNLRAFREAWKDEFGEELSIEEARDELNWLVNFYRTLMELKERKRRAEDD